RPSVKSGNDGMNMMPRRYLLLILQIGVVSLGLRLTRAQVVEQKERQPAGTDGALGSTRSARLPGNARYCGRAPVLQLHPATRVIGGLALQECVFCIRPEKDGVAHVVEH